MNQDILDTLWTIVIIQVMVVFGCCVVYFLRRLIQEIQYKHGIKASVLRSIPVLVFNSRDFEDNVQCIVCLSDLSDGDKSRVLPSCNHCFHAECIDKWLRSEATCPICRNEVEKAQRNDTVCATPGNAHEVQRDTMAVVIDIPAEPEFEESGSIKASVLN